MPRGKPNYIDPVRKGATFNVRPVRRKPADPVVYFVQAENGLIKIGNTKHLAWRLASLRAQSPMRIELLATASGGRKEEFAYHARFASHRKHGEWFDRCPEILAEIDRLTATPSRLAGDV